MTNLTERDIHCMAEEIIKQYKSYMQIDWDICRVDPVKVAEMCGCKVMYVDFGEDSDILGFTSFNDMTINIVDVNQAELTIELTNKSIIINEALKRGCEGRLNFTIAHETAHHIINSVCGADYAVRYRMKPHCIRNKPMAYDYDEYLANRLAAEILMPEQMLKTVFVKAFGCSRVERINSVLDRDLYKRFCAIAVLFGVSKTALAIRLHDLGMLVEFRQVSLESIISVFPSGTEITA